MHEQFEDAFSLITGQLVATSLEITMLLDPQSVRDVNGFFFLFWSLH